MIKREVSDGVIAPGYEPEALEILKAKKKGNYNVIQIDPRLMFRRRSSTNRYSAWSFEQGRNELDINEATAYNNVVTVNKEIPEECQRSIC